MRQKQKKHIIAIDYYSKFVEVEIIPSALNSTPVTSFIKRIFSRHGIPKTLISDSYNSENFANFSKLWSFQHVTSSPRYPRSNGQVEKVIQTIKNIIKKSEIDGTDLEMCLLHYRNTPISHNLPIPAHILCRRKLNTVLPIHY